MNEFVVIQQKIKRIKDTLCSIFDYFSLDFGVSDEEVVEISEYEQIIRNELDEIQECALSLVRQLEQKQEVLVQ